MWSPVKGGPKLQNQISKQAKSITRTQINAPAVAASAHCQTIPEWPGKMKTANYESFLVL